MRSLVTMSIFAVAVFVATMTLFQPLNACGDGFCCDDPDNPCMRKRRSPNHSTNPSTCAQMSPLEESVLNAQNDLGRFVKSLRAVKDVYGKGHEHKTTEHLLEKVIVKMEGALNGLDLPKSIDEYCSDKKIHGQNALTLEQLLLKKETVSKVETFARAFLGTVEHPHKNTPKQEDEEGQKADRLHMKR